MRHIFERFGASARQDLVPVSKESFGRFEQEASRFLSDLVRWQRCLVSPQGSARAEFDASAQLCCLPCRKRYLLWAVRSPLRERFVVSCYNESVRQ